MARILVHSGVDTRRMTPPGNTLPEIRQTIGGNSGNLLFADAVYAHLAVSDAELASDGYQFGVENSRFDADFVNDRFDALVIPAANWISEYFHAALPVFTAKLRKLKIPCVVLGLGAQSSISGDMGFLDRAGRNVREFLAAVSDRSETIGVRGAFTAGCLEQLGFRNFTVTGCPSVFRFGAMPPAVGKWVAGQEPPRIGLNGKFGDIRSGRFDRVLERADVTYFCQDQVLRLVRPAWSRLRDWGQLLADARLCRLVASGNARLFTALPPWYRALASMDCSIGHRFHGNVIALLAGKPALFITHDSRTAELVEHFCFPRVSADRFSDLPVEELPGAMDFEPFLRAYPALRLRLADFYQRNGLRHRLGETIPGLPDPGEGDRGSENSFVPGAAATRLARWRAGRP